MFLALPHLLLVLLLSLPVNTVFAQDNDQQLSDTILHKDSLFWRAYNTCDVARFADFFTDDVEFYHDKGGITLGLSSLQETFKNNLCSGNFRLRREPVEGSVKVFPLRKDNVIYGAILSGEHLFYVIEKGKEHAEGLAKFTHLWLLKDGVWKMTRVLSYDHGPAPYINKRKETALAPDVLRTYTGKYKGPQTGMMNMVADNNTLIMEMGNKKFIIYPEKEGLFFSKERDLTFEFVKSNNAVTKLIVRERGDVAEELTAVR